MKLAQNKEWYATLAFACCPGIGPKLFHTLHTKFGSAHTALHAPLSDLKDIIRSPQTIDRFEKFRTSHMTDSIIHSMNILSVQFLPLIPSQRSMSLCTYPPPAIGIFAQGNISLLHSTATKLALVGSRKPTPYGIQVTKEFTSYFTQNALIILSGLAIGIDSLAHQTCISEGGYTIGVLGYGHVDPQSTSAPRLYRALVENNGLLISQYPPYHPSFKGAFPARNTLMAWLSDAILVVEGTEHSGTRITAQNGLFMSKEIFCVPGSVFSPQSETPHYFIEHGAHIAHSPQHVCDVLGVKPVLSPLHTSVLSEIQRIPSTSHMLTRNLNLPPQHVHHALSRLEAENIITRRPDGYYTYVRATISG